MVVLPFCKRRIVVQKPKSPEYPKELLTIGDHLRKKRLDLELLQAEVADGIGVATDTIANWELNNSQPNIREIPKAIDFLGYDPRPEPQTWGEELFQIRSRLGKTAREVSIEIGVDQTTYARWERDKKLPWGICLEKLNWWIVANRS